MHLQGIACRLAATATFLCLAFAPAHARSTTKLDKLADDIEQALVAEKGPEQRLPTTRGDGSQMLVSTMRNAIRSGDLPLVQLTLEQVAAYVRPEALRERCLAAAADVRAQREAKEKEAADRVTAALNRTAEAIRAAAKPSDLDPTLQELGKLRFHREEHHSPRSVSNSMAQVEPAIQFVTTWQNYLAQHLAGDVKAAQESLDRLIGMNHVLLLPRSEILQRRYGGGPPQPSPVNRAGSAALSPPPSAATKIDFVLKTPDDLAAATVKVSQALDTAGAVREADRQGVQMLFNSLAALSGIYREFQAGLPTKLDPLLDDASRRQMWDEVLAPVRAQLIKLMLPRYLGLPAEVKARANEGVQEFLDRIVRDAVNKGEFLLAARADETRTALREGKPSESQAHTQAQLYVTAHNQEAAGQFALAVCSYQQALASGTTLVPPEAIGQRLTRIKAEHPEEFQAGMEAFLTPRAPGPPPGYPHGIGGPFVPHGPYGPHGPGGRVGPPPGSRPGSASPILPVPAASSPTPAVSPAAPKSDDQP